MLLEDADLLASWVPTNIHIPAGFSAQDNEDMDAMIQSLGAQNNVDPTPAPVFGSLDFAPVNAAYESLIFQEYLLTPLVQDNGQALAPWHDVAYFAPGSGFSSAVSISSSTSAKSFDAPLPACLPTDHVDMEQQQQQPWIIEAPQVTSVPVASANGKGKGRGKGKAKRKAKASVESEVPKRPCNSFILFKNSRSAAISAELAAANKPNLNSDISRVSSAEWHAMPSDIKEEWKAKYRAQKAAFELRYPEYVFKRGPNGCAKDKSKSLAVRHIQKRAAGDEVPASRKKSKA